MQYSFYALISRMKNINRWSLMRNTYSENVQEHSHMVAVSPTVSPLSAGRFSVFPVTPTRPPVSPCFTTLPRYLQEICQHP